MEEKISLYTVRSPEQKTIPYTENVQNLEKECLECICVSRWYCNRYNSNNNNQKHMKKRHSAIVLFSVPLVENSCHLWFFLTIQISKIKTLGKHLLVSFVTKLVKSFSDG